MRTAIGSYHASGRRLFVTMLLGLTGAHATAETPTSGRWATLEAIHRLENPRNVTRPGAYGELGAYQFRPTTWRMHTKLPFHRALDRQTSDIVAVKHYDWLKRGLEKAGIPATTYNIALAWNGGLTGAIKGTAPAAAHDYASRAANLAAVFDHNARRLAAAE